MPFGSESAWDKNFRTEADELGTWSPMPFGSESAWDEAEGNEDVIATITSPMPFGSESAWDGKRTAEALTHADAVTNAFRQ